MRHGTNFQSVRLVCDQQNFQKFAAWSTPDRDSIPRRGPAPLVMRKRRRGRDARRGFVCKRQSRAGRTSTGGSDISEAAVNSHNENPTAIALGKAHPHEPESER